ncbi:MAG: hypothetical protein Fur0028_01830 [Bacteroidales bacterium]
MGGHITGNIYGLHVKANRYSLYVDGKQFNNKDIIVLNKINNKILPTYNISSANNDIIDKGVVTINLTNKNIIKVNFSKEFSELVSDTLPIIITITPIGSNVNLYIDEYNTKEFNVKCINNDINKNIVKFNWIAIGTKKVIKENIPTELLDINYDINMSKFLISEGDTTQTRLPMWWDGQKLRFEEIPASLNTKPNYNKDTWHKLRGIKSKVNSNLK